MNRCSCLVTMVHHINLHYTSRMKNTKLILPIVAGALLLGVATSAITIASAASADTPIQPPSTAQGGPMHGQRPAAVGKVTAISGSSITITDLRANTTYTVDASNATIQKGPNTTGSLSDITVGSMIAVQGTVSGSSIVATSIHEGFGKGMMGGHGRMGGPGAMGTVTSISGNTITLTDRNGGVYTIDASSATVKTSGATSTLSNVKVGDKLMVRGKIVTASMTAQDIEDGLPTPPTDPSNSTSNQQ